MLAEFRRLADEALSMNVDRKGAGLRSDKDRAAMLRALRTVETWAWRTLCA